MPSATASLGVVTFTGRPSNRILPSSVVWMPEIAFTSVDFPAPLSPTRATTSPPRTSKSTPSRACTGPKRLLTPSSARSGPFVLTRAARRRCLPLDARRLACACERSLADVGGFRVAVLDDDAHVVLEHGDGSQDHRRHALLAVVHLLVDESRRHRRSLGQRDRDLRGGVRLGMDR